MKKKKLVVVDVEGFRGRNNLLFFRENVGNERHAWPMCFLYEKCKERNIEMITGDIYLSLFEKPKAILWRNNNTSSNDKELISAGAYPAILTGFENPFYACRFYWNMHLVTKNYDHTFMPAGAASRASSKTIFHSFISPQPYYKGWIASKNFSEKGFLILINGNAHINPLKKNYTTIAQFFYPFPSFVNRDLYIDRLRAVDYFSRESHVDLYGRGWNNPILYNIPASSKENIRHSWRGEVDDKFDVLKKYRFSICFENSIFDGWITEKIIDSFCAGCVPVYWGAPDITNYIPKDTFIDFREFNSYKELDEFLKKMDEKTWNKYIDNINIFLNSDQFYEFFSQERFTQRMIEIFESYF